MPIPGRTSSGQVPARDLKILAELEAPVATFRLFALEQAIAHGRSQELLAALERIRTQEKDEECLCLIPHALEAVRSRLAPAAPLPPSETGGGSAAGLADRLRRGTVSERIVALLQLSGAEAEEMVPWAMEILPQVTDNALLSMIIRSFGKVWPRDRLDLLLGLVDRPYVGVRCGAIETIAEHEPRLLIGILPRLLADDEHRVVAEALKAMARFDPEEARGYLDEGLRSPDSQRRQTLLRTAMMMPFEITRVPLLNCLAVAREPEMIEKAGLILRCNPDPDVPFRILELMARADATRSSLLRDVFSGVCESIRDSGILGDGFPAYLAGIKEAVNQKKEALRRANAIPAPEPPKSEDQERPPLPPPQEKVPQAFELDRFLQLSPEEQVRGMEALASQGAAVALPALQAILRGDRADQRLKEAALRAAIPLGAGEFVDLAGTWVQGSDEGLVTASLEYLGTFAPEKALLVLGRFHTSPNLAIRLAAMKVLSAHDPEQAVSLVMALLKNPNPRMKSSGLSCLESFDFSLVREALVNHLELTRDGGILDCILSLFRSNPNPDNLFLLFRMKSGFSGEKAAQVQAVSEENLAQIRKLQLITPEALDALIASFPARLKEMQERKAAPPPYARGRREPARPAPAPVKGPPPPLWQLILMGFVIAVVLYGLLWLTVL